MGIEPMNNGFAGRRVSHFAIRAHLLYPGQYLRTLLSTRSDQA